MGVSRDAGDDLCQNQCNLSAGDVEAILDGKEVGPWLFDGTAVSVQIDPTELEKVKNDE